MSIKNKKVWINIKDLRTSNNLKTIDSDINNRVYFLPTNHNN